MECNILLNQTAERTHTIQQHPPLTHARSEALQALFFAWNVANWICTKRLIPFLPTLIDALERHGHLHLTEESRTHLLQVSPATADRLLHARRHPEEQGLSGKTPLNGDRAQTASNCLLAFSSK